MRLLQYDDDGGVSLAEFSQNVPEYAILSHRWEAEEVTFKDLTDGTSKSKAGYGKIQFCRERSRYDGLQYFWVDTCCIDKSNSTELAEAINSMFRWYQKATKCYVYLSDVSIRKRKIGDNSTECTWESAFRASKWFTRGWTLQELLAPTSVEFFSRERERLGDKGSLKRHIQEITGITISALEGAPLSQFGIDERLSWAANRQTTREEDRAYSLLGIFGIHLPLIYGEGREHAFKRLMKEIHNPLIGKHHQVFTVSHCLSLCKKTSRTHSIHRAKSVYKIYEQQIPARTRSGSRRQRAGYFATPTSGSSGIPTSNNGATTNRTDYSGSRVILAKARQC